MAGISDWAAAGLATEGRATLEPRAGELARRDVVTCRPDEPLGDVRSRVEASPLAVAVVTNAAGIVLGILRDEELEQSAKARVDAVMRPGPSTFRPNVTAEEMARYMREHELESAPITSSDGHLIGLLLRSDAEAAGH